MVFIRFLIYESRNKKVADHDMLPIACVFMRDDNTSTCVWDGVLSCEILFN